jgi:hypothetical protein
MQLNKIKNEAATWPVTVQLQSKKANERGCWPVMLACKCFLCKAGKRLTASFPTNALLPKGTNRKKKKLR